MHSGNLQGLSPQSPSLHLSESILFVTNPTVQSRPLASPLPEHHHLQTMITLLHAVH